MRRRQAAWLAVVASLALMAALTTVFQLGLPRFRSDWIVAAMDQHNLVMHGAAGSPWQYRVLSDYLFDPLVHAVAAAGQRQAYLSGLLAFVVFRGLQVVCLFSLGFVYYRKLGLGPIASIIGLGLVCLTMVVGQIETNWQLDVYTDVVLSLVAAIFVLSGRIGMVIPVAILAAFNRETGVFIPLMPLALVSLPNLRSAHNLRIFSVVGAGIVLFVLLTIGVHVGLPSQELSTRVFPDVLVSTLKIRGIWAVLAVALAVIPLVGALGLRVSHRFVRVLFWLMVPVWMASHAWGNVAMTPLAFLVPLALVLVPSALFTATQAAGKTHAFFESVAKNSLVEHWETVAALGAVYVVGPVVAGVVRLGFPFPLERIEGTMLQEVRRVVLGQGVYVAPSLDYVPLLYAPVYVYVSAGVALLTGTSFLPLRLVSLVAAGGSALLLYGLVSRDAPGRLAGFLAAGLFLGTTQLTPTDRYPARVDALCLLLVLAAIAAARQADRRPQAAMKLSTLCGCLVGLAILTKQTAAVAALPLALLALPHYRARLLPYLAAAGATLALAAVVLFASSGGWARYYLVDLPRNHGIEWSMLAGLWTEYLLPHAALGLLFGVAFFVVRVRQREFGVLRFYGLTAAGLVGMSWAGVLNPGGGVNSMGAAYAALGMLLGLGFQSGIDVWLARLPVSRALPIGLSLMAVLALAQVDYSSDQPASLRANARAGNQLAAAIATLPGPVFAPDLEEYQSWAGKGDHATAAGVQELLGSFGGKTLPEGRQYLDSLDQALSNRQFAYVLFDPEGFDLGLKDQLAFHRYELVGPLMANDAAFAQWRRGSSSGGGYLTPSPMLYAPPKPAG